MEDFHPSYW